ncbi:MAG: shikimate dehydrogenase [Pseudomonadota bacterium]
MAEQKKAFVIGYPAKHSRSPMIHTYWLEKAGLSGSYEMFEVAPDDVAGFLASVRDGSGGYCGGNVTIPHKEAALALADIADPLAKELGAANTLWVEDGRLMAMNTDGYGFATNMDEQSPGWDNTDRAVILGAGGASRAIIQTLRRRGIGHVHIVNRTIERAQELAVRFGSGLTAHPMDQINEVIKEAGLFVNTTSLGMGESTVPDIDFGVMASQAVATDLVYTPLLTPILAMAQRKGVSTVDGLGMLLHQAVPGFEKWFGIRPVVTTELRDMVIRDLEKHP